MYIKLYIICQSITLWTTLELVFAFYHSHRSHIKLGPKYKFFSV